MKKSVFNTFNKASIAVLALTLTACGANAPQEQAATDPQIPDWVLNPYIEDGIAATDCVISSNNMSIDRKQAIANARADIAQQVEVRVKAMDKTYARKTETSGGASIGSSFESVSKQLTRQNLSGARPIKVQYVTIDEQRHLCAMVAFGQASTRELFENIVANSGTSLNPQDESVLYEEFKAFKAQQELDQSLQNY